MGRLLSQTPLRWILTASFVTQIAAVVGLTAWLSIRNGQKSVNQVASQLRQETTVRISAEIDDLLSTARVVNDLSVKTIQRQDLDLTNIRSVEDVYWDYINTFPTLLGLGVGNTDGDILGLFRQGANGEPVYFLEYSSPATQGRYVSQQLDSQRQTVESSTTDRQTDARERPWYQAAVAAAGPVWTDVYTSISAVEGHSLAINASQPVYTAAGQLQGVVSVILDLGAVSQLLRAIEPSPSGQVFIIEADGSLIGSSDGENPMLLVDGQVSRLAATESKSPLIRAAAAYLDAAFDGNLAAIDTGRQLQFALAGERQYLQITPIRASDQLQWLIVVVAPESDFMEQINANTRNTIWLCIAALALATGSSILTARWLTQPLLQLNQASRQLARGNLQLQNHELAAATAGSQEVSELAHAFAHMAQQLQASFAALQESEANFRNMADNVPGAIFRYVLRPDDTDAVLYMSPGCYQLWEVEAQAVEQDASLLWKLIDPEDVPGMRASVKASAHTLQRWDYEWRITTPSGQRKWLQGSGRPTPLLDGTVLWHTVILDVSDRKAAEVQLQDLSHRLELAAHSAEIGIWEWDVVSDRLLWDERMYQLYGIKPDDFSEVFAAWEAGVHPQDLPGARLRVEQALSGQQDFDMEFRVVWPDGTIHHLEAHATVQRDDAGQPTRMIGVNWDITERKQTELALAQELLLSKTLFDASMDGIVLLNAQGDVLQTSTSFAHRLGYTVAETLRLNVVDWEAQWSPAELQAILQGTQPLPPYFETLHRCKDGFIYEVEISYNRAVLNGQTVHFCICRDISDRKQAESERNRLIDVLEASLNEIYLFDSSTLKFEYLNQGASKNLGYSLEQMQQMTPLDIKPQLSTTEFAGLLAPLRQGEVPKVNFETVHQRVDGSCYPVDVHLQLTQHKGQSVFLAVILDISDRKRAEAQLIHQALHDSLTDLPNRTLLMDRLELAIKRAKQSKTYGFALLFLDLDQFKVINDSLGHQVGDQLLISVGQKLQELVRPTDLAARIGGDEFVILLEHLPTIQTAIQLAERILAAFEHPIAIDGHSVFTTTCIGLVWGNRSYTQASDLLRDADIALYRAKAQGRKRYEIFDVEMHIQVVKRQVLEHDLRLAIAQQAFALDYQPIIDLKANQIVGVEALIRWHHPVRGVVSPAEFIPVAEETGLVVPISQWVLQTASQQVATWQQQFAHRRGLRVSVNLSGQDLRQVTLVETIRQILTRAQLPAQALTLEVTESMLIEDVETTIDLLEQLRALGVHISIDDFGTGYSSLSYLYNLPADYLKIDKSFVSNMHPGNTNYKIVQAVTSLSDQLEIGAIAEGIETSQQLQWLRDLGCELGQGYWLSRPLSAEAATALLASGRYA